MPFFCSIQAKRVAAEFLFFLHLFSLLSPLIADAKGGSLYKSSLDNIPFFKNCQAITAQHSKPLIDDKVSSKGKLVLTDEALALLNVKSGYRFRKFKRIGGPSQPEMRSFKPVSADNMVNLFTGDFSYNIPLMDVGGYPVNIFYDGNITMEQEASWVGLGWNINPGTISRNMRGVPDDFNGDDQMKQTQTMKPNITWGARLGSDLEILGIKQNVADASIGISFNNYLGPAIDLSIKGTLGLSLAEKNKNEKSASPVLNIGGSLALNSRSGFSIAPSLSLSAKMVEADKKQSLGLGMRLGTSFNSRTGIGALQLSEQVSFNRGLEDGTGHGTASSNDQGVGSRSVSISFSKPSYIPALRMPITNTAYAGHIQFGAGVFGQHGSIETEVYMQKSEVEAQNRTLNKPLVGYFYYQNANTNADAVMDFTRLNDNEVTPNTPIISAPQYTYDVFSIQGEGTGGSIRAYRNDLGYVRDNLTISKDKSLSVGGDVSPPGHFGANFSTIKTPTSVGEWKDGNLLRNSTSFKSASGNFEHVYFRNPGETSVLENEQYKAIGGTALTRYQLGGSESNPTLEPTLKVFPTNSTTPSISNIAGFQDVSRKKRTQVISYLTAKEADIIGLDKSIKSYLPTLEIKGSGDNLYHSLQFENRNRIDVNHRAHHISQINVTEANGKRYIYGIPVYNLIQKDFTFSVAGATDPEIDKVDFDAADATINSPYLENSNKTTDGYLQITETPAYAHSFLLSGLLSPDYVDVTGDGITEDDLGSAVKFNYTRIAETHKWQTPISIKSNELKANFNPGKLSEKKDDKGYISFGERESWYTHSIESKTMIAIFTIGNRLDGKGVTGALGIRNNGENAQKRLDQIDLYSKADLRKNGIAKARPIKTVHFKYNYQLCKGTPDHSGDNGNADNGKLTLERIWFTFNGQHRPGQIKKQQYVFDYGVDGDGNPAYEFNGSDRWGTYKPITANPMYEGTTHLRNAYYPYTPQTKADANKNAGAWALKKVLLPSGGQIEITYESDDYAFVQNKRASNMMEIVGFGNSPNSRDKYLYEVSGIGIVQENDYVFIKVPQPIIKPTVQEEAKEVFDQYLSGQEMFSFKLAVAMPKGEETIMSYANLDGNDSYGVSPNSSEKNIIWLRLKKVDGHSPLSLTAIEYLREHLPGQAFKGYDVSETQGLQQIGAMMGGWWQGLKSAFQDPSKYIRSENKAKVANLKKCFVRLNDPDGYKFGGGSRVKTVRLKDNWQKMNEPALYTSEYGQEYTYETSEIFNGQKRMISSGVASYEPSLGGEENPFQNIVQIADKLPLGPASYGAIEMPMLDAFFLSPSVGYSKITVKSLTKNLPPTQKSRSGVGKQITEFYTSKDYPVRYRHTPLDPSSDRQTHQNSFGFFFYKFAFDSRALSQGFLVETNDMHGKMKSQASYPENDTETPISYTENFYKNTGENGLDETFNFVHAAEGGIIKNGNMGIDIELMTDAREFSVKSKSLEVQGQVDLFPVVLPFWVPFIWPVIGKTENTYRAVTSTKIVNYHSIVDKVVSIDKGSKVSTQNIAFDAETGNVVVNQTNNEWDQAIYSTSYPAYWAYSGMGPAYKNIDAVYTANFRDGLITSISPDVPLESIFESGDELYLIKSGDNPLIECDAKLAYSEGVKMLWASNKYLVNGSRRYAFMFMDVYGKLYTKNNVEFRIVRSGKRNMLNATVASVVSMENPIVVQGGIKKLQTTAKVVQASITEFSEARQTDKDILPKIKVVHDANCITTEVVDCINGSLENAINPYRKGLLGNFMPYQSRVFYGERDQTNPKSVTNLPINGYLADYVPYWEFEGSNNFLTTISNAVNNNRWVFQKQITRTNGKGLELETKDANDIYTSAQYGFNKTTPVAIANNARYEEMFCEGFEDGDYNESLNGKSFSMAGCLKHFDYSALGQVVQSKTELKAAHSGKAMLKVAGDTHMDIPVAPVAGDTYNVNFTTGTLPVSLINPGANIDFSTQSGFACQSYLGFGSTLFDLNIHWNVEPGYPNYKSLYTLNTSQYIQIDQDGAKFFSALFKEAYNSQYCSGSARNLTLEMQVYDMKDNSLFWASDEYTFIEARGGSAWEINSTFPICFKKGIYKINLKAKRIDTEISCYPSPSTSGGCYNYAPHYTDRFTATFTSPIQGYRDIDPNTCAYTKPIAATEAMLHPTFSIPNTANKEMLFSAWVRDAMVAKVGELVLNQSGGGMATVVDLEATGPVIEGWRRIEQKFTLPAGTSSVTLRFLNSGSNPIYFDDIRTHPFNANMKSYTYDPISLRLVAELDANNYATFYEYDEEGTLVRTKAETKEGIKTITETRSAQQAKISSLVP